MLLSVWQLSAQILNRMSESKGEIETALYINPYAHTFKRRTYIYVRGNEKIYELEILITKDMKKSYKGHGY